MEIANENILYSCCFCNHQIFKNKKSFQRHSKGQHKNQIISENELNRLKLFYCPGCKSLRKQSTTRACNICARDVKRAAAAAVLNLEPEEEFIDELVEKSFEKNVEKYVETSEKDEDHYRFDSNFFQSLYFMDDYQFHNVS